MSLRIPPSREDGSPRRQSRARILFAGGAALVAITAAAPAAAQTLVGDGSVACGTPYTISSGDSLSSVAARAYGDPMLYGFIAEANWDALGGNPERVSVGMELAIPCIDASGQVLTAEEAAEVAASIEAAVGAEGPLAPAQLDALFGPVALFPDPVLFPLLVAVTFPLDVVKAARFVADAEAMPDKERAAAAAAQPWDKSVQDLAAAFPDLLTRMNDHLDWTEQAGEAVLAQTDDVLAAIQRLRSKAQENGYLVDNPAQEIVQEGDAIYITPADPQVVYVPTYDSQIVYAAPAAGPPVYYYDDYDGGWEDALVAGGIILGSAIVLDEIFDDDDWDGWGDWDDDVNVDWDGGDITIDRDEINIDRDEINIDRGDVADRVDAGDGRLESVIAATGSTAASAATGWARASAAASANWNGRRSRPAQGSARPRPRPPGVSRFQLRPLGTPHGRRYRRGSPAARGSQPFRRGSPQSPAPGRAPDRRRHPAPRLRADRPRSRSRRGRARRRRGLPASRTPSRRSSGGNQARAASSRGRSSAGGRSGGGRGGGRRR